MLSIRRLSLRRLIAWPDSRRLLYIDGGQTPMVAPSGLANKPILHKPILQSRFKSSIAIDGSPFEQHLESIKRDNATPREKGYTEEMEEFSRQFLGAVQDVYNCTDPATSSHLLRNLVKSKLLMYTDMRDRPEKFFLAHRLLSTIGLGGFGIRFTVQFNLFAGSVVGLGGPEHHAQLELLQTEGKLGCFLLTEMQAGVLSGLIVETTADYDPVSKHFILHTPSDKAAKNWISQGFVADMGVVIADLRVAGRSHGPHPFLISMRDDAGQLRQGIRIQDMGTKTVANDLDNARVWFDQVRVPTNALLNRYCDVIEDKYVQLGSERMRIEVIGQRLLTGRMAIGTHSQTSALQPVSFMNMPRHFIDFSEFP
jgi:alkylation response protein AidB-like acyl-CoA dehydrogenase